MVGTEAIGSQTRQHSSLDVQAVSCYTEEKQSQEGEGDEKDTLCVSRHYLQNVDLNESHREVEPIVNFRSKAGLTFIKMNETYTSGTLECTVLKAYSTVSKQFAADTFGEEYSQLLLDKINKFQGYYDENGNLYNEGHRFFLIKMHLKYLGKNTSKIQFDSPIICKYPDGTYYSLGGIDYIDKALLENESHHITLNPGDEFDSWFLYEAYRYSHDKTYYLRGSFQNYIDDDSYSGYLVKLNDIEDVE